MNPTPMPRSLRTSGLGFAAALLALASASPLALHATDISWSATAGTTAWTTGTNWIGNTAPADSFTTDNAVFNQTSYTNQPTLSATRSIAGLILGDGSTATAATTITQSSGALKIGGNGIVKNANSGAASISGGMRISGSESWANNSSTALTIGSSGTTSSFGNDTIVSGTSTLTLGGSGSGQIIVNNAIVNANATLSLVINRTGSGEVVFNNTGTTATAYSGGTTITSGTLLVNSTSSGSGTGSGTVTVNSTGVLGGSGTISGATTANSGAFLAPGSASGSAGTLTFGSSLNISGLASGTGGLLFDLGAVGSSDKIALSTGALSIGTGVLNFNDFSFTALSGFGTGTYTLFATNTSIVGSFGSNLSGTIGGFDAVLSFANSNQDIILTVTTSSTIPEPSACAALIGALALGAASLRRRQTHRA